MRANRFIILKTCFAFSFKRSPCSVISGYSGSTCAGVARSIRMANSNRKIASSMPTSGITRCCVLGKVTLR